VPQYLWSTAIVPGRTIRLARFPSQRGASVSGYVRTPEGAAVNDCPVELLTMEGKRIEAGAPGRRGARPGHSDAVRFPLQARTDVRGFFQIVGPEPSEYQVVARQRERLATGAAIVRPGEEARLRDYLVLEEPYSLEVSVDPPTAPGGGLWTLRPIRLAPFPAPLRSA